MFAGPNGSGKTVLQTRLKSYLPAEVLGVCLNPDEIERSIRQQGFLDLAAFGVTTTSDEVLGFFQQSRLLASTGLGEAAQRLNYAGGRLDFGPVEVNSYFASVIGDFLRQRLLAKKISFTCETVMSHPSKVELLKQAQSAEYRTYLYFIATDDPKINISRVGNRVKLGGHPVPENRITSRYYRSLDLLMDAIQYSNRAYIFDNSGDNQQHTWLAEITEGRTLELKSNQIPAWFKRAVLDKIKPATP
jgi:predicted ABC-type ATPase